MSDADLDFDCTPISEKVCSSLASIINSSGPARSVLTDHLVSGSSLLLRYNFLIYCSYKTEDL